MCCTGCTRKNFAFSKNPFKVGLNLVVGLFITNKERIYFVQKIENMSKGEQWVEFNVGMGRTSEGAHTK
jgi:hypothetical protein